MSSDGSTWDQTTGTNPAGVDWNQYDEELSGQPSLMFLDNPQAQAAANHAEPAATVVDGVVDGAVDGVVDDPITHSESFTPLNGIDSNQLWSSNENSVTFSAVEPTAAPSVTTTTNLDEPDLSSGIDTPHASTTEIKSQSTTDPDFHWNLHAPEFEFRPREVSQLPEPTPVLADSVVPEERKLSATELLVRSSNDAELAVLLAAANEDPDEEDVLDHMISPRSDAVDDHHQHALINGIIIHFRHSFLIEIQSQAYKIIGPIISVAHFFFVLLSCPCK